MMSSNPTQKVGTLNPRTDNPMINFDEIASGL